ncbi:hypothetical protein JCM8547_008351 [Rhodosporidiobolus lusitaniae]
MTGGPVLTTNQRSVLEAVADAAFQAHGDDLLEEIKRELPPGAPEWQKERIEAFVKTKFTDLPGATDSLLQQFNNSLSPPNLNSISAALSLLSTRAGTLLLAGHPTPFPSLTFKQREAVLQSWRTSRLPLFRQIFRGLALVSIYVCYSFYDEVGLATGFPAGGDEQRFADPKRLKPHHPYEFESISTAFQVLETDILVIGSGAGGGVVSAELSKKGRQVLVVEKGEYLKPEDTAGTQKQGYDKLYESRGLIATEDGAFNVLAGSNFGGGTTVNWSASLRPQQFLCEDWAKKHSLPYFLSQAFNNSVEAVCKRMGVSDGNLAHNKPNSLVMAACEKLGFPVAAIPQNTDGTAHSCGTCGFGCVYGEKQGSAVSWLRDAAEQGARFFKETTVERLLFASSSSTATPTAATLSQYTYSTSRRTCIGALVKDCEGKTAIVRAQEAVVLSAGSLHSPAVLMRSGLKNPNIGRNLRLHPCAFVTGFYPSSIKAWEGAIMTSVSTVEENWDGSHHGSKIEVIQSFPAIAAGNAVPWTSSREHKKSMAMFGKCFTLVVIARDKGSGRIILDSAQQPRMEYTLSSHDSTTLTRGAIASAKIHLAAGATRIVVASVDVEPYEPQPCYKGVEDPRFLEWLKKVERAGIKPGRAGIGSAHQMGSCQMGTKPSRSVVDPRGRVWGISGLYVADASVFPTASGVNPMITNMALSHSIAGFVDEDIRQGSASPLATPRL